MPSSTTAGHDLNDLFIGLLHTFFCEQGDISNRIFYYRTMYNCVVRSIDLNTIDFDRVAYRAVPLDGVPRQTIVGIEVK